MKKQNCWEFKKCGREPGGAKAHEMGICPAATEPRTDGIHGGVNGGRVCWAVAGTYCKGRVQGEFAAKILNCMICDFHNHVCAEEGYNRLNIKEILDKLK